MKKIYLTALLYTLILGVKAQCTPDTSIKATGIFYNDTIPFCINQEYNEVFQMAVTNDTIITFGTIVLDARVDSAEIVSVTGLPTGINYVCPTTNCKIINSGGEYSHNCMVVSGIPTALGEYNITFKFRLYGFNTNIDQNINLDIEVVECITTGITNSSNSSKKDISIYPQPANSVANLEIRLNSNSNVKITIHDLLGQEVTKAYKGNLSSGVNNVNISEAINLLDSGLYLITTEINSSGKTESYTKRLVIE